MEVTVRDVTGAVHMLDITPTMQLREMKSCVAGELGFADEAILLKYNGEVLVAEGQVVSDMGVAAGDEFEVSISTKGAARMRLKEAGEALALSAARRLFSCGSSPDTAAAYMEAEIADRECICDAVKFNRYDTLRSALQTSYGQQLVTNPPLYVPYRSRVMSGDLEATKQLLSLGLPTCPTDNPFPWVSTRGESASEFFSLFRTLPNSDSFFPGALLSCLQHSPPASLVDHLLCLYPDAPIPLSCLVTSLTTEAASVVLARVRAKPEHLGTRGICKRYTGLVGTVSRGDQDVAVEVLKQVYDWRPFGDSMLRRLVKKAAERGLDSVVSFLISKGALPADAMSVARCRHVLEMLIEGHRFTPDEVTAGGDTPLMRAVLANDIGAVEYLVAKGVDCNRRDNEGSTPLLMAARRGDIELALLLIKHGADITAVTPCGNNAVAHAAAAGRLDMVDFLLGKGACAGPYPSGLTLAMMNAKTTQAIVGYLLDRYPETVHSVDYNGMTVLMHLARGRHDPVGLVERLVGCIDAKCKKGVTALGYAVVSNKDFAKTLLGHGATEVEGPAGSGGVTVLEGAAHGPLDSVLIKQLVELGAVVTLRTWVSLLRGETSDNTGNALHDLLFRHTELGEEEMGDLLILLAEKYPKKCCAWLREKKVTQRAFCKKTNSKGQNLVHLLVSWYGKIPFKEIIASGCDCLSKCPDTGYTPFQRVLMSCDVSGIRELGKLYTKKCALDEHSQLEKVQRRYISSMATDTLLSLYKRGGK